MTPERVWLDPGMPLAESVAGWLLAGRSRPHRLRSVMVVVPTLQAGRRLRYALAKRADVEGTGVLTGPVLTPMQSIRAGAESATGIADDMHALAAWAAVLGRASLEAYPNLFPAPVSVRDTEWTLRTGRMLQQLRRSLAEGGWTPSEPARRETIPAPERKRWEDLMALERLYRERLAELGFRDDVDAVLAARANPVLPEGIDEVVIAGTPDPAPVSVACWAAWPEEVRCRVLIPWDEADADAFDAWGRPVPEVWMHRPLDRVAAGATDIAATTEMFTDRVSDWIAGVGGSFGVGAPEGRLLPAVSAGVAHAGLAASDPAGEPLRHHPVGRLIEAVLEWRREGSAISALTLIRHDAVAAWLSRETGADMDAVYAAWDTFAADRLPLSWRDVVEGLARSGDADPGFRAVCRCLEALRTGLETDPAPRLLGWIREVFRGRTLQPGDRIDDAFLAVGRRVGESLHAAAAMPASGGSLPLDAWWTFLKDEAYYLPAPADSVELEGWLELAWNGADHLLVAGMNEGAVPDGRVGDVFLPDSLREELGLRSDAQRHARDAWLAELLVRQREGRGGVTWLVSRRTADEDVLMPSRLLLQVAPEHLPERVQALFHAAPPGREPPAPEPGFTLTPLSAGTALDDPAWPKHLSASRINDYLKCPFYFYLTRVLGMEAVGTGAAELDPMGFGSVMHEVLRILHDEPGLRDCTEPRAVAEALDARLTAVMSGRFGPRRPVSLLIQEEAMRQRLRRFAGVHCAEIAAGWRIEAVELDFTLDLDGLSLAGRIDRLDRHENGTIRVLDYKTAASPDAIDKAHLFTVRDHHPDYRILPPGKRSWKNVQVPLYVLYAQRHHPGCPVEAGYVHLPKAVSGTAVETWPELVADGAMLASARACMLGVADDIRARRFWPPDPTFAWPDEFAALFPAGAEASFDPSILLAKMEGRS